MLTNGSLETPAETRVRSTDGGRKKVTHKSVDRETCIMFYDALGCHGDDTHSIASGSAWSSHAAAAVCCFSTSLYLAGIVFFFFCFLYIRTRERELELSEPLLHMRADRVRTVK